MVIAAFAAAGKSYFCKKYKSQAIDFICMPFKYENFFDLSGGIEEGESIKGAYDLILKFGWELEYAEAIKEMEEDCPELCIVIPPVKRVLDMLKYAGEKYTIIYPKQELLDEYIERCRNRGNTEDFIDVVEHCWNYWVSSAKTDEWAEKIELSLGQYMSDVIHLSDNEDLSEKIAQFTDKYLVKRQRSIDS